MISTKSTITILYNTHEVRALIEEYERNYDAVLRVCFKKRFEDEELLECILDDFFNHEIKWRKIGIMLTWTATEYREYGNEELIDKICDYIDRKLNEWIEAHGGWDTVESLANNVYR
jgi:hypothetical protein